MLVQCPHCENRIDLLPNATLSDIACPSCGSHFSLLDITEDTETMLPQFEALRNFKLLERVGVGHFGTVWKAHDTSLDRIVAVKVPHRANVSVREAALFYHEAQSAASLEHPNIVTVFEVGRADNMVFIVSQFVEGVQLKEWIQIHQPNFRRIAQLCCDIGDALHHAHEKGIIHRDLKPQNVLVDGTGKPFVTDFGLAKRDNITYTIAVTGQPLGTPAYMPPEQARGEGNLADRRSDTYSLGVMLYEMLTGQRPFSGGKHLVLHQIMNSDPRPLRAINRHIPRDLETICLKALSKSPNQRYQTAEDMVADLQHFLRGEPIKARPVSFVERCYRWARRKPAAATAIAFGFLLLILIPFLFLRGEPGVRRVQLSTSPAGAKVVFIPLDSQTGIPLISQKKNVGKSPVRTRLRAGDYLVVAYLNDETFHEVYRHVPGEKDRPPQRFQHTWWELVEGSVMLPSVRLFTTKEVTKNMAFVDGGTFKSTNQQGESIDVRIPNFYVELSETTIGTLRSEKQPLPLQMPDSVGAKYEQPANFMTQDEATEYAENLGGRLLDYAEYRYLTKFANQQPIFEAVRDAKEVAIGPLPTGFFVADRFQVTRDAVPIVGIFSNVDEWASNWFVNAGNGQDFRMMWTGFSRPLGDKPPNMLTEVPSFSIRYGYPSTTGMRRARSARPRLESKDFIEAQ